MAITFSISASRQQGLTRQLDFPSPRDFFAVLQVNNLGKVEWLPPWAHARSPLLMPLIRTSSHWTWAHSYDIPFSWLSKYRENRQQIWTEESVQAGNGGVSCMSGLLRESFRYKQQQRHGGGCILMNRGSYTARHCIVSGLCRLKFLWAISADLLSTLVRAQSPLSYGISQRLAPSSDGLEQSTLILLLQM